LNRDFLKRNFYNPFKQCAMDLHFTEILIKRPFCRWSEMTFFRQGWHHYLIIFGVKNIDFVYCRAVTSPKKRTIDFVFLSWWLRLTWNLKLKFKFQVFPSRQDRKTNSFVRFLGEITARQFSSEIYWPLTDPRRTH
jgi:hypothetical protein